MTSVNFEPLLAKTSTKYNVHFLAEHPLKMGMSPSHKAFLDELEAIASRHGMIPISAAVGRSDDQWGENESRSWVQNFSDDLILSVAKLLDGFVAQMVDPESDVMAPDGGGPWDEPNAVWTAEAFLQHRAEQKR